jgi:aminoglycoside phosphotransferase (APT) family kinase protein
MPPGAVADCRAAWRLLAGTPAAVVHGDPGPANIRMDDPGVGLLDWDEARVDYCDLDLDLAQLPARTLPPARQQAASIAVSAWEAANGWIIEPPYARRQLVLLQIMAR